MPLGAFIALEGGEGAGKSTQGLLLVEHLRGQGLEVVPTREPGGTPACEAIREVVLSPAYEGLDARAEALLFAASRGEHAARVIRPALDRGAVVVCDRYVDSSVAYQGYGRHLGADTVRDLSMWATGGLVPDLTILLDVDPALGLSRLSNPDRLEAEPIDYHRRVRDGFRELAAREPQRYLVLDATASITGLASTIAARVDAELADRALGDPLSARPDEDDA
ncbi:MAG: dTMP kinase [Actinobacteria bacterium]|uniref:dTMP kinase n=1 Tax=freshwater metagenome TaxID=449393 RepID=A0A6J7DLU4_9ZZZZ|nr:dTMP kinase [Actinomycetota bacterium]